MLEHTLHRITVTSSRIKNWVPQLTKVSINPSQASRVQRPESSAQSPESRNSGLLWQVSTIKIEKTLFHTSNNSRQNGDINKINNTFSCVRLALWKSGAIKDTLMQMLTFSSLHKNNAPKVSHYNTWDMHTRYMWNVCSQAYGNNRIC